jgi:hypothetical protein
MPYQPNKNGAAAPATPPPANALKIDADVPLPDGRRFTQWKALAKQMKPGDSVLFTEPKMAARAYAGLMKAVGGKGKIAVRKMPDGWRVWRLK